MPPDTAFRACPANFPHANTRTICRFDKEAIKEKSLPVFAMLDKTPVHMLVTKTRISPSTLKRFSVIKRSACRIKRQEPVGIPERNIFWSATAVAPKPAAVAPKPAAVAPKPAAVASRPAMAAMPKPAAAMPKPMPMRRRKPALSRSAKLGGFCPLAHACRCERFQDP